MRNKEESHDYRYFPDPDLPPLILEDSLIENLKKNLPELPDKKKERFINLYKLKEYDAEVLVSEKDVSNFFEELVKGREPKLVVSWLTGELFAYLNKKNVSLAESSVTVKKIADLIDLISDGTLSNRQAKEIFEVYLEGSKSAKELISEKGMAQISDEKELSNLIVSVLEENEGMVKDYKSGKDRLFGFFVGQVMKLSRGKANPQMVNKILMEKLKQ